MYNSKNKSVPLGVSLFILGSFVSSASAAPMSAAQQNVVSSSLEKSARSRVSLEMAVAELESALHYNRASLTEVKVLGIIEGVVSLFWNVRGAFTPDLQESLQHALEKTFGVQLSKQRFLENIDQLEKIINQLNELMSVEKEIELLANEILASGDDERLEELEARLDAAVEEMIKAKTSFDEFSEDIFPPSV